MLDSNPEEPETAMPPENSDLAAVLKDYVPRREYEDALEALNDAVAERDAAAKERDAALPRLAELQGKVRDRSWRDSYETARKAARVRDEHADDVYELLKLKRDADEPDARAIESALGEFLARKPHYAASDQDGEATANANAPAAPRVPPGGAPGARSTGSGAIGLTREQLSDPKFMLDPRNKKFIAEATAR